MDQLIDKAYIDRAQTALGMLAASKRGQNLDSRKYVSRLVQRAIDLDSESAERRWGNEAEEIITKAAVPAIGLVDVGADAQAFLGRAAERSVVGRIQNLRRVPFHVRTTKVVNGALAYWVAETQPRPLSRPALAGETLVPGSLNALIAVTKEAVGNPAAETLLESDLLNAVAALLDSTFLSDDPGVLNTRPAGIAYNAPTIASTGNLAEDVAALVAAFDGDLLTATLIASPSFALRLALTAGGNAQINVGPGGGNLFGIPMLTSNQLETDSNGERMILVDAAGITANIDGLRLEKSFEATLAMADDPSSPAQMVSLFQTNTIAFLATVFAGWNVSRAGSVVVLTGL